MWNSHQVTKHKLWAVLCILLVFSTFLVSCFQRSCTVPDSLERNDVFGRWTVGYDNYRIWHPSTDEKTLQGQEEVVLLEDGTYQHTFSSTVYSYTNQTGAWRLITDTVDGPKLRMDTMKYFAQGVQQANSSDRIELDPHIKDALKIQNAVPVSEWGHYSVSYPSTGYLYLYPRICSGELVLLQMVYGPQDPDDLSIQVPVFRQK